MATITLASQTSIANLYTALFNRAPDAAGFDFWTQALANGASLSSITASILSSPESTVIYTPSQTDAQFVTTFYQTVFGRAPDAGGLAFWTAALIAAGGVNSAAAKAQLVAQIVEIVSTPLPTKPADLTDTQYAETVKDRDLFAKKVVAGIDFAVNLKSNDLALAKQVFANLTTPPTPPGPPPIVNQTFLLTAGTDVLGGGAGDDTFNAPPGTLQSADELDGGAGIDTLNLASSGSSIRQPTLKDIEIVNVVSSGFLNLSLAAATGVECVGLVGNSATSIISAVKNATLSIANQSTSVYFYGSTAAELSVTLNAVGEAGSAAAVNFGIGATAPLATAYRIVANNAYASLAGEGANRTVTVDATGANALTLWSADPGKVTSLTVTGSGYVDFSGVALSGLTSFIGGDGGVKLSVASGFATGAGMHGGAGRDTLVINDTMPSYAAINQTTGFEVLALGAPVADLDIASITNGIDSFAVANVGTTQFTNAKSTTTFGIDNRAGVSAVSIANASGQTATDITLNNSSADAHSLGSLALTGATAVSLTSSGTAANVITTLANADNSVVTIKGAADLTITNALAATSVGSTVNAAAFTGKLTITGSSQSDTIVGGAGDDVIDGGIVTHGVAAVAAQSEVHSVRILTGGAADGEIEINGYHLGWSNAAYMSWIPNVGEFIEDLGFGVVRYSPGPLLSSITYNATTQSAVLTYAPSVGNVADISTVFVDGGGVTFGPVIVTAQGVTGVTGIAGSLDTLTGGAGADTFLFRTPDVDSAAGYVTAIITDFQTGVDRIQVTHGTTAVAGSATAVKKVADVFGSLGALLTAADTALTGDVKYWIGAYDGSTYLVTDGDGAGYTNVIELAGVTLAGIQETDLIGA